MNRLPCYGVPAGLEGGTLRRSLMCGAVMEAQAVAPAQGQRGVLAREGTRAGLLQHVCEFMAEDLEAQPALER